MADMQALKQLRDATFAPLKDCKEALDEANGNIDEAQEILKKKGILKAGKKGDRETNEGIVKLVKKDGRVAGIKLLCETDFVAKNEIFIQLADTILDRLLANKQELAWGDEVPTLEDVNTAIAEFVGKIGENVRFTAAIVTNKPAYVYNHPGNKVASIIYFEGGSEDTAKELALQVTAMCPTYLSFEDVPVDQREKLLAEFKEEMKDSWKPANIIDQIIEGKLKKSLADVVLMEQEYIRDGSKKIKEVIPSDFKCSGFLRMSI